MKRKKNLECRRDFSFLLYQPALLGGHRDHRALHRGSSFTSATDNFVDRAYLHVSYAKMGPARIFAIKNRVRHRGATKDKVRASTKTPETNPRQKNARAIMRESTISRRRHVWFSLLWWLKMRDKNMFRCTRNIRVILIVCHLKKNVSKIICRQTRRLIIKKSYINILVHIHWIRQKRNKLLSNQMGTCCWSKQVHQKWICYSMPLLRRRMNVCSSKRVNKMCRSQ